MNLLCRKGELKDDLVWVSNTPGTWLGLQSTKPRRLNEPTKEGAVPHYAHQVPLFPNQGPLNPILASIFLKSNEERVRWGAELVGCASGSSLPPAPTLPLQSVHVQGPCARAFLQAALTHFSQDPPKHIHVVLTSKPLHVLFPLPGIPSIPIYWCPLRKLILKLKTESHFPLGAHSKMLCACVLCWVDRAGRVCPGQGIRKSERQWGATEGVWAGEHPHMEG